MSQDRPKLRRVRFEFTVATAGGDRDVAVTAPDGASSADLRQAVADAAALCGIPVPARAPLPRTGRVLSAAGDWDDRPDSAGTSVVVAAGRHAGTVRPLHPGRFVIGRASDCDLVLEDASVSRKHVALDVSRRRITARDLDSTNGCHIDGERVDGETEFRPGQLLELGNSVLAVQTREDETRASISERGEVVIVNRTPRPVSPVADAVIDLPANVVAPARLQRMALVGALVPAALGTVIAVLTGSMQFLLFSALTPVMLVSTALGERVQWRRSRRRAMKDRRRALHAARKEIATALLTERDRLRSATPHPGEIERIATTATSRLWERGRDDPDVLRVRVGTATLPSLTKTRCGDALTPAGTISAAPVCVDLRAGPLGVCGPPEVVRAVARWLIVQLATLHSPALVRLTLVLPSADEPWHWARWLPHLRLPVVTAPTKLIGSANDLAHSATEVPLTIVVVDATGSPRGQVCDAGDLAQVIYLAREPEAVPTRCTHLLTVQDPRVSSAVLSRRGAEPATPLNIVLDQVDVAWAERVARALAPLADGPSSTAVAAGCPSLCELLGTGPPDPAHVAEQWQHNSTSPRTALGIGPDGPVWIDLRADGPHCLVAGTTGAGKSELLRTLVTGLALACPPSALNFILIDYKGGAAFAACADLPHTSALVTDLDEQSTARALRSLGAELRRRERLLASAGVADIEGMHRVQPGALPRLVVVVDEFAALADELPSFVTGLVAIAQRGRSLGLHLVLATQRPGRAVTPEIKANTSLRIALRVTDVSESIDVIEAPDAARIPPDVPGAGFVRAGDRVTAFRAARAGPPPSEGVRSELIGRWRQPLAHPVGADAEENLRIVVQAVGAAAQLCGAKRATRPWLTPLPLHLADSDGPEDSSEIRLGLVDLPDVQRQDLVRFNLATARSVLACGTTGSGRTGMLLGATLRAARQLSPAQLEIHVIERSTDVRAALAALPHLGCAVSAADDLALVVTLLRRLAAPVGDAPAGCSGLRLLLIDDWDAILAVAGDGAASRLNELLTTLLRIAADRHLTVLVTGDRSLLAARWTSYVGTRLLLRLADRADYALAGIAPRDVPGTMPAGRALRADDGAEVQLFAPPRTADETRSQAAAVARRWAGVERSSSAVRIRPLPERVTLTDCVVSPTGLRIGVGGDSAVPLALDPFGSGHVLVAGPPRSGRSTVLLTLLAECRRTGVDVAIAAPRHSPLHARAAQLGLSLIDCDTSADLLDEPPTRHLLLLIDDCEAFDDTGVGARLADWLRRRDPLLGAVVAGRTDDLASAYRGLGAEARRNRSGVLLRPRPLDGELFGVRLERTVATSRPGRGVLIGVRGWATTDDLGADWLPLGTGDPVPIQIAMTDASDEPPAQPPAMWAYR